MARDSDDIVSWLRLTCARAEEMTRTSMRLGRSREDVAYWRREMKMANKAVDEIKRLRAQTGGE